MQLTKQKIWLSAKDYIIIVVGIAIYGFGFSAFIAPEGVITGGMTGLGQVIYYTTLKLFGWGIPVAVSMYAINAIMLFFAYRVVGKTFVVRTVFGVTVISLVIGVMMPLFPEPIVKNEPFMNVVIGSLLCGIGVGLALTHNGSTGGTDIVAALVAKKTNVSIGRTMQMCDFCIISSSLLIFGLQSGVEKLVFGFIVLFIVSTVCDQVINTNRQAVQFTIFSRHWEEIATAINNDAHRGCTVLNGMGWYSKQDVKVLLVMCRKYEAITISRIIKSIDKDAFITQANVNGVYGQGFDELKLKMKHPSAQRKHHQYEQYGEEAMHSGHPARMA